MSNTCCSSNSKNCCTINYCGKRVFYGQIVRAVFHVETNLIKPLKCGGTVTICGILVARRINESFEEITIDTNYQITKDDVKNLCFIASDGNNTVILPDPTTIPKGFVINICNSSASTADLDIQGTDITLLQGQNVELILNSSNMWSSKESFHSEDFTDPHHVTKSQVGLSEVINCKQVCESNINQPDGVTGLNYLGEVSKFNLPQQVFVEQVSFDLINDTDTELFAHSADPNFKRLIQVYSGEVGSGDTLLYNRLNKGGFIQEDSTQTTFENDVLALQSNISESNVQNSYLFNNANNRLIDSSGNNNGVLEGAGKDLVTFPAGIVGQAINFTPAVAEPLTVLELGSLDVDNPDGTTFSVWFNLNSISGDAHILSKSNDDSLQNYWFLLGVNSDSNPFVRLRIDSGTSITTSEVIIDSVTVATGTWYQFVVVYDGTNILTYVSQSGVNVSPQLRDTTNSAGNIVQDAGIMVAIGNQPNPEQNGEKFFDGLIDQVLVYDTALGLPAITSLYNSGSGVSVTGFDTTQPWYVITDDNQLDSSNWNELDTISVTQTTPASTDVRYQISIDNKITWYYWDGVNWQVATLGSVAQSNTKTEIEALTTVDFNLLFASGTFDIAVILETTDSSVTPDLTQIALTYKLNGFNKVSDNDIAIIYNGPTSSSITNNSGGVINNVKVNILLSS